MCGELFSSNFEVNLEDDPGSFGGAANTRKWTDILGLILMIIIFGVTFGLAVYCINNSQVEKLINGFDNCGNICGRNNIKSDSIPFDCFGQNFETKKYLYMVDDDSIPKTKVNKYCFEFCIREVTHHCVDDTSVIPFYAKLYEFYWWIPIVVCVTGIIFCGFLYYIIYWVSKVGFKLRNRPEWIIVIVILIAAFLLILSYQMWSNYDVKEFFNLSSFLVVILAVMVIIMIPSLYGNLKKVDITHQLYQEVKQATNSTHLIWILPIISSIIFTAYVYGMTHCLLYVESFSYAEKIDEQTPEQPIIEYIPYPIATMTQTLLIYTIFLLYEFMKNLQTLIISGSVAQSYFTKQNNEESKHTITPLLKHLGTVCCASLILSATFPIRLVVNALKGIVILSYKKCLYSCSRPLLTETLFLTRNGLIMTAIHGSSFWAGTIRARKLLRHNVFNAAEICTFGDFTCLCWKLIYWVMGIILCYLSARTKTYAIFKRELVYIVCCGILIALLLDYCSSVSDVTINTILLCFCEDCLYNNGAAKPYFMSANFAQFVENANKFVDEDKWNTVADSWKGGPGRLY